MTQIKYFLLSVYDNNNSVSDVAKLAVANFKCIKVMKEVSECDCAGQDMSLSPGRGNVTFWDQLNDSKMKNSETVTTTSVAATSYQQASLSISWFHIPPKFRMFPKRANGPGWATGKRINIQLSVSVNPCWISPDVPSNMIIVIKLAQVFHNFLGGKKAFYWI